MPGKKEDLRYAEAVNDPDLNFSYNELMDELTREYNYPERQPGDVTPIELADVTNLSDRQWYTILNRKVRDGELVKVLVKEKGRSRNYYVYRKKSSINSDIT